MRQIPAFIANQWHSRRLYASFNAVCLYLDVSAFTQVTESLMRHGPEGAEVLTGLLHELLAPIITCVHAGKGYIAHFAGDALVAFFPHTSRNDMDKTVRSLRRLLAGARQDTRFGAYSLCMRAGLAWGMVHCRIIGNDYRAYCFYGPAVRNAIQAQMQAHPGQISVHPCYSQFQVTSADSSLACHSESPMHPQAGDDLQRDFALPPFKDQDTGEFRQVVSVFLGFPSLEEAPHLLPVALNLCRELGGFYREPVEENKGWYILCLFGAPVAYEAPLERAVSFAVTLRRRFPGKTRVGLCQGTAFCGFIGTRKRGTYTTLGNTLNLSARLMSLAGWDEILLPAALGSRIKSYAISHKGKAELKGFSAPVDVAALRNRRELDAPLPPLIGRQQELARLRDCRQVLARGVSIVLTVHGAPGMGKSFLVRHALAGFSAVASVSLTCIAIKQGSLAPVRAYIQSFFSREGEPAHKTFARQFKVFSEKLERQGGTARHISRELVHLRSFLAAAIDVYTPGSLFETTDARERPGLITRSLYLFFLALAARDPLVIVMEDIQWLDEGTRALITRVLRKRDLPVCLICTARYGDDGSTVTPFSSVPVQQDDIHLAALNPARAGQLVRSIWGHEPPSFWRDYILTQAEGNPYFIQQICLYIREQALAANALASTRIPTTIMPLLMARIDRLPNSLRRCARMASVLGKRFSRRVALAMFRGTALSDMSGEDLLALGESLTLWASSAPDELQFSHDLLCKALLASQAKQQLRQHHLLAADSMVALPDPPEASAVAYHYFAAEAFAQALPYYVTAGTQALDNYAKRALDYFGQALACQQRSGQKESSAVYMGIANACKQQEKYQEALLWFARALQAARQEPAQMADILTERADVYLRLAQYDKAETDILQVLDLRRQLQQPEIEAVLTLSKQATLHFHQGRYDSAMKVFHKCLSLARTHYGDSLRTAEFYGNVAFMHNKMNQYGPALEYFSKALAIYRHMLPAQHPRLAHVYNNISTVYASMGQLERAVSFQQRSMAIKEKTFGPHSLEMANSLNNLAGFLSNLERHQEALDHYQRSLDIVIDRLGGNHPIVALLSNNMAAEYDNLGKSADALALYRKSFDLHMQIHGPDSPNLACNLINLAHYLYNHGYMEEAMTRLNQAMDIIGKAYAPDNHLMGRALVHRARAFRRMGRFAHAEADLLKAAAICQKALPPGSPEIISTKRLLAATRLDMGQYRQAASVLTGCLNTAGKQRRLVTEELAWAYACQGKYASTVSLLDASATPDCSPGCKAVGAMARALAHLPSGPERESLLAKLRMYNLPAVVDTLWRHALTAAKREQEPFNRMHCCLAYINYLLACGRNDEAAQFRQDTSAWAKSICHPGYARMVSDVCGPNTQGKGK